MRHLNRIKARQPRSCGFYCRCDRSMVREGSKCPHCGRNGKIRDKKPSPIGDPPK